MWGGKKTHSKKSQAELPGRTGEWGESEGPSKEIPVNVGPDNEGT